MKAERVYPDGRFFCKVYRQQVNNRLQNLAGDGVSGQATIAPTAAYGRPEVFPTMASPMAGGLIPWLFLGI